MLIKYHTDYITRLLSMRVTKNDAMVKDFLNKYI